VKSLDYGIVSFCGLKNKDTEPIRIYRTFVTLRKYINQLFGIVL